MTTLVFAYVTLKYVEFRLEFFSCSREHIDHFMLFRDDLGNRYLGGFIGFDYDSAFLKHQAYLEQYPA